DNTQFTGKKPGTEVVVDIKPVPGGEPLVFIFKTVSEPHVGELSYFRVLSGSVTAGLDLQNQNKNKTERLTAMYAMNGKNRKDLNEVITGDIGAVVKLK